MINNLVIIEFLLLNKWMNYWFKVDSKKFIDVVHGKLSFGQGSETCLLPNYGNCTYWSGLIRIAEVEPTIIANGLKSM